MVYFQPNGSRSCCSGTVLAHWTGHYAVDISRPPFDTYHYQHATSCRTTWFSQDACTGVWTMIAFGWALASRVMAAWPLGGQLLRK